MSAGGWGRLCAEARDWAPADVVAWARARLIEARR